MCALPWTCNSLDPGKVRVKRGTLAYPLLSSFSAKGQASTKNVEIAGVAKNRGWAWVHPRSLSWDSCLLSLGGLGSTTPGCHPLISADYRRVESPRIASVLSCGFKRATKYFTMKPDF